MTKPIRRVGVVGSGVMGSGIAAHMANAGLEVILLDIVPRDLSDEEKNDPRARNRIAAGNLKATTKAKPALFFHPSNASLITVGNIDDDLEKLEGCDLVVEAIIERLDIKRSFFEKLDKVIDDDTVVASNTSGLRIVDMVEGRDAKFRKSFLVMHFFNPVRYMKLLELVRGSRDRSRGPRARRGSSVANELGKGIVIGKDTPNFVGNRIGVHSMMTTIHQMEHRRDCCPRTSTTSPASRWDTRRARRFAPRTSSGSTPSCTSRRTATTRSPDDEERDVFSAARTSSSSMVEKKILGNKTQAAASTRRPRRESRRSTSTTLDVPRQAAATPAIKKA